ncbi:uncharacterized protein LOC136032062 isoform X2 [Artemia franciscana]
MLVNWLLIELDEVNYQRHSLVQLEVRQPIINFYTMLLLAGVIRPVEDGNINGVDMDFERLMSCESVSKPTKPGSCKNLDANRLWHCSKKVTSQVSKAGREDFVTAPLSPSERPNPVLTKVKRDFKLARVGLVYSQDLLLAMLVD